MKVNNLGYNPNYYSIFEATFPPMEMEGKYTAELIKLGDEIRRLRKLRNLTQVDLEVRCGIDNGDISRIENGRKNLEFYTIVKLAEALEVQLYDLFKTGH